MKLALIVLLATLSTSVKSVSASSVETTISKSPDNTWLLSYSVNQPVYRLAFVRNPDNSRTERWIPTDAEFEVVMDNNKEYLQRVDGSKFSQVSVNLTATYKHLPKDYAPFSPYSDGGMLIYTGRLFACANECNEELNNWRITIEAPPEEHVIVQGKVIPQTYRWMDSDNGTNVYVGTQTPVETPNVLAVIDEGLPERIKLSLDSDIPEMMDFLEARLGKITGIKPTLFASYANVNGHSSQGGTLPNQIFVHWNLNNLNESVLEEGFLYNTLWFFAHEVAHLYQENDGTSLFGSDGGSWIHEGNAEWLALKVLKELYPDTQEYVKDKVTRYKEECAAGLGDFTLSEAAEHGRFDLYYTCGLLIHKAIDEALVGKQGKDIYSLWNAYQDSVKKGDEKGAETFLKTTEKWTSPELVNKIKRILYSDLEKTEEAINGL